MDSGRRMAGEGPVRQPIQAFPEPPSETEVEEEGLHDGV